MSRITTILAGSAALMAATLTAAAPAAAQETPVSPKLAAMSAEQFQARMRVIDDPLETNTVISTEEGYRTTRGLLKSPWNDNHLRAVIDKRTGAARFEVRQTLRYYGSFRGYAAVNYQTETWPVSDAVVKIRDNAQNCTFMESGEVCFEEVTFTVDEAHLRQIAARRDAATPAPWAFKFKAGAAHEHRAAIVQAEVVGLLQAVDAYKRDMRHVNALADQPGRAG